MSMLLSLMLAVAPVGTEMPMPQDLSSVPVIHGWLGRKISPRWSEQVARLYRHGQCQGTVNYEGSRLLQIDVLFLLSGDGKPLKIAPVNANCPPEKARFVGMRVPVPRHLTDSRIQALRAVFTAADEISRLQLASPWSLSQIFSVGV